MLRCEELLRHTNGEAWTFWGRRDAGRGGGNRHRSHGRRLNKRKRPERAATASKARPMCANGSAAERSAGAGDRAGAEAEADGSLTSEETKRTSRLRRMAAGAEGPIRVTKWRRARV